MEAKARLEEEAQTIERQEFVINSDILTNILDLLAYKKLLNVEQAVLSSDEEGWRIKVVDPGHIALIDVRINRSAFGRHESLYPIKVGLDVPAMLKFLKKFKDMSLGIEIDEEVLKIETSGINPFERTYSLIDTEGIGEPDIPSLALDISTTTTNKVFKKTARIFADTTEELKFRVEEDEFLVVAEDDHGELRKSLGRPKIPMEWRDQTISAKYSVDYLLALSRKIKRTKGRKALNVEIFMSNLHPCRFKWNPVEGVEVNYYQAPWLRAEDEA